MRFSRALSGLLMAGYLAGCSAFPGQHFQPSLEHAPPTNADAYTVVAITPELLQAQAADRTQRPVSLPNPDLDKAVNAYSYRVGPRDVLSIAIWGDPTAIALFRPGGGAAPVPSVSVLSSSLPVAGFKVDADGSVYFPYVGRIAVAAKTTAEIRDLLIQRLAPYIRNPQVTVDLASFNSQKFQLAGAVVKPGLYPITDVPLTVSQAIAAAGGAINQVPNTITNGNTIPRSLADLSHVTLLHEGKRSVLDIRAVQQDGNASEDRIVRDGDIIQVPDNAQEQVHIIGEVPVPGNYPLNDGALNLVQLLGDAGQINTTTANASRVFVFRGLYQKPEIFWLDMESPVAMLLANQFELQPHDIVYVAPTALTNWSRVISQILPTVQTLYETKVLVSH